MLAWILVVLVFLVALTLINYLYFQMIIKVLHALNENLLRLQNGARGEI